MKGIGRMSSKVDNVINCMLTMQRYSWEQGVCAQALYEAGRDDLWIPMAFDAVKRQHADGRLALIGSEVAVSDPASNGEVCLRAYECTGDSLYLDGARRMLDYLENTAPRTADGVICHNLISFEPGFSPSQLWIDGLYMVPPFLACMGRVEQALEQVRGYFRHLYDVESGVFFHIVDMQTGAFVRRKRWATGNGWALMGLARIIEEAESQGYTAVRDELSSLMNRLLEAMLRYQLPDGRFHDILDEADSFVDGTSAMMMAAAVYRGLFHGYISPVFGPAAEMAYQTVAGKIDSMGLIHEVCGCTDFVCEGTSAEAQAAFVMADAWRKRINH